MTDRLKKLGFSSRTSRTPVQQTPPAMQNVPGPAAGRPPSYPGYAGAQGGPLAPPGNNNMRPISPNPPGAPGVGYPHNPNHVPIGHPGGPPMQIPRGIPPSMPNQLQPQHPPYYGHVPPPVAPTAVGRPAEVEGSGRSKAQLIVGIDFVSIRGTKSESHGTNKKQ